MAEEGQKVQMISVPLEQWRSLNFQIRRLKQQNLFLKEMRKVPFPLMKYKSNLEKNLSQSIQIGQPKEENTKKDKFKSQMSEWSKRISTKSKPKKSTPVEVEKHELNSESSSRNQQNKEEEGNKEKEKEQEQGQVAQKISLFNKISSQLSNDDELNSPYKLQFPTIIKQQIIKSNNEEETNKPTNMHSINQMRLIQAVCLYGPSEKDLQKPTKTGRMSTPNSLLYIDNTDKKNKYEAYKEHFFPVEGVPSRRLKEYEVLTNCDKIIFRKNQKRTDCSLMIFEVNENKKLDIKNQILNRVNGIKRLGCFFIQFKDFIYLECEQSYDQGKNSNQSMDNLQRKSSKQLTSPSAARDRKKSNCITVFKKCYIKAVYTLCLFTYFPFINVIQQILNSMMDQIKVKRIQRHSQAQALQKVSISFFIQQLNRMSNQLQQQVTKIPVRIGEGVSLKIGHYKILFNFMESKINDLLFGGWVFEIIKKFDKDLLYDIFTNIMSEQSLCFVCEDLRFLTSAVFFFISVLPNPFEYPHPCISRILNLDFLESPFVMTSGLNQSSKWVDENSGHYDKKIFIDLNGEEAKVKGKRKLKIIKSQKLKKIFTNFYKKLEGNSPMPQIFKKKQTIIRPVARQQNELIYSILKSIQNYYAEQIFKNLPNPQIINLLRQSSSEKNKSSKISLILKQVKKYLIESRKQKEKDMFIESLVDQQIFYMYLQKIYRLE